MLTRLTRCPPAVSFFERAGQAHFNSLVVALDLLHLTSCTLLTILAVSFFERAGQAHFNSLVVADADGSLVGHYRKSHIPDGPGCERCQLWLGRLQACVRLRVLVPAAAHAAAGRPAGATRRRCPRPCRHLPSLSACPTSPARFRFVCDFDRTACLPCRPGEVLLQPGRHRVQGLQDALRRHWCARRRRWHAAAAAVGPGLVPCQQRRAGRRRPGAPRHVPRAPPPLPPPPASTPRAGVLICWDQWFPEGARCAVLQGAEVRARRRRAGLRCAAPRRVAAGPGQLSGPAAGLRVRAREAHPPGSQRWAPHPSADQSRPPPPPTPALPV